MSRSQARRRAKCWLIAAGVLIVARAFVGARDWDLLADIVTGGTSLCLMTSMYYSGRAAGHRALDEESR